MTEHELRQGSSEGPFKRRVFSAIAQAKDRAREIGSGGNPEDVAVSRVAFEELMAIERAIENVPDQVVYLFVDVSTDDGKGVEVDCDKGFLNKKYEYVQSYDGQSLGIIANPHDTPFSDSTRLKAITSGFQEFEDGTEERLRQVIIAPLSSE